MNRFIINGVEYRFYIRNISYFNSDSRIDILYPKLYWIIRGISNGKINWADHDSLYFRKNHSEAANYLDKYVKNIAFV